LPPTADKAEISACELSARRYVGFEEKFDRDEAPTAS